jgi:hypothetical protein
MTVILVVLVGLALLWLAAAAWRYGQMVDFRRHVRERADAFLAEGRRSGALDYPPVWLREDRRDRGIVMCAGGPGLLTQAWTNLDVLRNQLGCTLPVALYYVGREEMPEACQRFFEDCFDGLECIDATRVPDRPLHPPARGLGGFETKPFVLMNAPFDELVFIDADSVPLRNPVALFDSAIYAEHGNVFWPDVCMLSSLAPHAGAFSDYGLIDGRDRRYLQGVNPRIFDYMRLPRPATLERAGYETESGQIVLDRRRCFDAVQLAWFWSARPRHFRLFFYGDTEMYRLAFGVAGRPYGQIPHLSHHAGFVDGDTFHGKAMVPRDEDGQPLFLHQMHRKPSLDGAWRPLTHVTTDPAVDHPRARKTRDVSMRAPVGALADLRPLDGPLEKIEERIRIAREALLARRAEACLPPPRPRPLLRRRLVPW